MSKLLKRRGLTGTSTYGLLRKDYYPVLMPEFVPFLALWSQKDGQVYEPKTMLGECIYASSIESSSPREYNFCAIDMRAGFLIG